MLIKCTQKLLDELKLRPAGRDATPSFFCWHAHCITQNRHKVVLVMNDATRMSLVLYGLKAPDFRNFEALVAQSLRETLLAHGVDGTLVDRYLAEAGDAVYTKTDNRQVLAMVNRVIRLLDFYLDQIQADRIVQTQLNLHLLEYLTTVDGELMMPSELLQERFSKFKSGESLADIRPVKRNRAYQLKITLDLENMEVWRRILVPAGISFGKLHSVIQSAFLWLDYHLYDFKIYPDGGDSLPVAMISEDDDEQPDDFPLLTEKTPLSKFLPSYSFLVYTYDYGECWLHLIELEDVTEDYPFDYPTCIDGVGDAPPDDAGGEEGFKSFLAALDDADHPDHANMAEWGKMQEFERFDLKSINKKMKSSLKKKVQYE